MPNRLFDQNFIAYGSISCQLNIINLTKSVLFVKKYGFQNGGF